MIVSVFNGYLDPRPTEHVLDWLALAKCLTRFRPFRPKKQQLSWSPTIFRTPTMEAANRSKANAYRINCLVYDMDDGKDNPNEVMAVLQQQPYNFALHTTSSSTQDKPRFRVIFPFQRVALTQTWSEGIKPVALPFWVDLGFRGTPDLGAICDIARLYSLPHVAPYMVAGSKTDGIFLDTTQQIQDVGLQAIIEKEVKKSVALVQRYFNANNPNLRSSTSKPKNTWFSKPQRQSVGEKLGAKFIGDRVQNWPCPECCQTDATFFYLGGGRAFCKHENSCSGWIGSVEELANQHGIKP